MVTAILFFFLGIYSMRDSYDKHFVYMINNSCKILQDWYCDRFTNEQTENQAG